MFVWCYAVALWLSPESRRRVRLQRSAQPRVVLEVVEEQGQDLCGILLGIKVQAEPPSNWCPHWQRHRVRRWRASCSFGDLPGAHGASCVTCLCRLVVSKDCGELRQVQHCLRQGVHPASVAKVLQGGPFQWRSLVYVGCGVVRLTPPLRAPFATIFCPTHATRALSGADVAEASPGGRDVCRERRESREVRLRGWLRHGSGTTRTLSANTKADCARANMATDAKVCMTIGGSVRSPCRDPLVEMCGGAMVL